MLMHDVIGLLDVTWLLLLPYSKCCEQSASPHKSVGREWLLHDREDL